MNETPFPDPPGTLSNAPELSVSELAGRLKRTVEDNFDRVRVRGELGRVTIARSGHIYADLKDESAVINTVMWKGNAQRLAFKPEEGLEVVAEGKLSIYAGRSAYQLIAETMRPAGVGALMALLEERRKKLAAEGLFEADRKQALPFLPRVIGVVTSPTGAVIRDILHRIEGRFPAHVLVWPALVQGDLAAGQIEAGILGFNAIEPGGPVPRPDVIIVARGGGSIEDLWPFNEENVVRAAAGSVIPLISAVGHETDTTLIDYVSDARAPTPTGAAEIAVPVRADLAIDLAGLGTRLSRALVSRTDLQARLLAGLAARLPAPARLLEARQQRFDYIESRLARSLERMVAAKRGSYQAVGVRLRPKALQNDIAARALRLDTMVKDMVRSSTSLVRDRRDRLNRATLRLSAIAERQRTNSARSEALERTGGRLARAMNGYLAAQTQALSGRSALLRTLSHEGTLQRGFALVRDEAGALIRHVDAAKSAARLELEFADGRITTSTGRGSVSPPQESVAKPVRKTPPPGKGSGGQGSLF